MATHRWPPFDVPAEECLLLDVLQRETSRLKGYSLGDEIELLFEYSTL